MGIERTWEKINDAAIILYVFDAKEDSFETVNKAVSELMENKETRAKCIILIGNKTDQGKETPEGVHGVC